MSGRVSSTLWLSVVAVSSVSTRQALSRAEAMTGISSARAVLVVDGDMELLLVGSFHEGAGSAGVARGIGKIAAMWASAERQCQGSEPVNGSRSVRQ